MSGPEIDRSFKEYVNRAFERLIDDTMVLIRIEGEEVIVRELTPGSRLATPQRRW